MPCDSPSSETLKTQKQALRRVLTRRRAEACAASPNAAALLSALFLSALTPPAAALVSTYRARAEELNPAPLGAALQSLGHSLCLPVVTGKGHSLQFRAYSAGDLLHTGAWNIEEPLPTAPVVEPDILLVPLLGFDRRGYRLGYGGGYYDRTINGLRLRRQILAIGIGYAAQEMPHIPCASSDAPLDIIVTEQFVLHCPTKPP